LPGDPDRDVMEVERAPLFREPGGLMTRSSYASVHRKEIPS